MGKKASRRFNPAVRNAPTFVRKKVKPGRHLRHDNATNTSVKTKRIVVVEQLKTEGIDGKQSATASSSVHLPRKTLDELITQLGHYNENLCRDAIHGVRLHFKNAHEQLAVHMRIIVPGIGSLLVRELKLTTTRNQLKGLIEMLCDVPSHVMCSYFSLFCTYVLTAISDLRPCVRALSFDVLLLLLKKFPDLCRQNGYMFAAFLRLMEGQWKPENRTKLLDSICHFVTVFGHSAESQLWPERTLNISLAGIQNNRLPAAYLLPSPCSLHFAVLSPDQHQSDKSPLMTRDGVLNCCRIFCPILEAAIRAEEEAHSPKFNAIMTRAHSVVSRLIDVVLRILDQQSDLIVSGADELRAQLAQFFGPLRRYPLFGASKKLSDKMNSLKLAA